MFKFLVLGLYLWVQAISRAPVLNIRLHHFRDYVTPGEITIHHIDTTEQPADFLTKSVNEKTLNRHRKTVMGW